MALLPVPINKQTNNRLLQNTFDGLVVSTNVGRIEVGLAFYAKSGSLKVTIVQCLDLPVMAAGATNAFVRWSVLLLLVLMLLSGKVQADIWKG
jgi:hypothetical protein